ncbi:selenide, water dikinase SelD [Deferrisoma palaeochoriense]
MAPGVLVGLHTGDDAGVVRVADGPALVQTVDFITPVVDDPRAFGRIAAANSLSDVYAMGGRPLTAMNVLLYPSCDLPAETVREVLAGGAEAVAEAGASLVGGHSVDNPELVYGLAVTGLVDPDRMWTNAGARPGDLLVLTKPLGVGLVTTAGKAGLADAGHLRAAAESMAELNRWAAEAAADLPVHAATDVTGFGLAGHAGAVARESGADLVFSASALPVLPGAGEALGMGLVPGGAHRNRQGLGDRLAVTADPGDDWALLVSDPQTSGGLLLALPPDAAETLVGRLAAQGRTAWIVGRVEPGPGRVRVEP